VERSVAPGAAPVRLDGCQASSFPAVEEPDPPPADVPPPVPAAWDASAAVPQDAMADAADLRPEPADVVEKLVGQEPDVPEQHASRHQSELPAVPAAEPDALALCKPVADLFVERSSAARVVAAEPLVLRRLEALAERSRKPPEAQAR